MILWSLVAAVPFMAVAPRLSPFGFTALLAVGGLLLQSTLPISVTFAQTFVKGGAATVSSLMMGFAWGMGSLFVPLIGASADRFGIEQTLVVLAFVPLLAACLAWRLPDRGVASRRAEGRFPAVTGSFVIRSDRGAVSILRSLLRVRPRWHHACRQDPDHHRTSSLFVLNMIVGHAMTLRLGFSPQAVFEQFAFWQPFTYMFLHSTGGFVHILFNMLALWMFGTELERTWGTRFFTKYYFVTGVGAAATSLLLSLWIDGIYYSVTVGASGAIYGLLLAYAMYFPHRRSS